MSQANYCRVHLEASHAKSRGNRHAGRKFAKKMANKRARRESIRYAKTQEESEFGVPHEDYEDWEAMETQSEEDFLRTWEDALAESSDLHSDEREFVDPERDGYNRRYEDDWYDSREDYYYDDYPDYDYGRDNWRHDELIEAEVSPEAALPLDRRDTYRAARSTAAKFGVQLGEGKGANQ